LDNLTHTLFAATLERAVLHRMGRGTTATILLASNAPDLDIVTSVGGGLNYLAWHRGPTHGPLGVVGLGALCAVVVWLWYRLQSRESSSASLSRLMLVGVAGVACHVLMDLLTSYGTRLLSPFDWRWYAVDLMPIIDLYLLAALAAGLIVGRRSPTLRQRAALAALGFMIANYAVRSVAHHRALGIARTVLASTLPPPCADMQKSGFIDRWPLRQGLTDTPAIWRERGATSCLVEMAAVPTFFSPMRWDAIARASDSYWTLDLHVIRDQSSSVEVSAEQPGGTLDARAVRPWQRAVRYPDVWTPAALEAAQGTLGRVFLNFSRFPATSSVLRADGSAAVGWTDLRFVGAPGSRPGARRGLFSAVVIVGQDGDIQHEELGATLVDEP
jgi:inner membrane protein